MRPRRHAIAAGIAALTLAGCGITDPYQARHSAIERPAATSTASSTATTNDPSDRPAGNYPPGQLTTGTHASVGTPALPSAEPTPQAALERYARLYANWTARTLAQTQRELAAISLGSAHANALQAAASYGRDSILLHSHVRNSGSVVAIAPAENQPGTWVIVSRERTTGQGDYTGLPPQLHITYAHVTHRAGGYLVSQWSPQT